MLAGERQQVLIARALFGEHERSCSTSPPRADLPEAAARRDDRGRGPTTVLAAHHLEEIPATTTHAALLRDGPDLQPADRRVGSATAVRVFRMPIVVGRADGRWTARAGG
jgi:iron complex transport system ATP-binding protein